MHKRHIFIHSLILGLYLTLGLTLAACGQRGPGPVSTDDMYIGSANAPITLIEYASVACAHCAAFNAEIMPELKAKYIDTGQVRYIYREFLTPPENVSAAGILLARCAGKDNYFKVTDAVMRAQPEMFADGTTQNALPVLLRIGKSVGMSEKDFNKCITNAEALTALEAKVARYAKDNNIDGTPAFFINGKRFQRTKGDLSDFDTAFTPLLEGK